MSTSKIILGVSQNEYSINIPEMYHDLKNLVVQLWLIQGEMELTSCWVCHHGKKTLLKILLKTHQQIQKSSPNIQDQPLACSRYSNKMGYRSSVWRTRLVEIRCQTARKISPRPCGWITGGLVYRSVPRFQPLQLTPLGSYFISTRCNLFLYFRGCHATPEVPLR